MTAHSEPTTAPLLRLRPDGTPEMLVLGSLENGAPRYEVTAEARAAWTAGVAIRAQAEARRGIQPPAVFSTADAAAAWIQRREAERGRVEETKEPSMKRALDLFCKAGGATKGLQRAGYHVTGVDIEPQPRYCGDVFHQDDAMAWLRGEREPLSSFDLIWASPPCQAYSRMRPDTHANHPDLVAPVRDALNATGAPYIIENVEGAPLQNALMLCGTMFGLLVVRHRLFETSPVIYFPPGPCAHQRPVVTRGNWPDPNTHYASVVGHFSNIAFAREAMGIEWMTRDELAEAIPPAYSEFLARHILDAA